MPELWGADEADPVSEGYDTALNEARARRSSILLLMRDARERELMDLHSCYRDAFVKIHWEVITLLKKGQ